MLEAEHIILATGSRERLLPGVTVDGQRVWTSYEALQVEAAPESLIIIGAGAVGVEFASVFATYGTHVTLIEMLPTLVPLEDPEIAAVLADVVSQTRHANLDRYQGGKGRGLRPACACGRGIAAGKCRSCRRQLCCWR